MMTEKAHATSLRKIRFAFKRAGLHLPYGCPPILALTDPARTPDPVALAKALPRGSGLIYRHFGTEDRHRTALSLSKIAARRNLSLLIGNDPGLALAVRAQGVHWPEANMHLARHWKNRFAIMTCAVHSRRALTKAKQADLSAALLSSVFPSQSPSAGQAIGPLAFRQLARESKLPLYALGGLNSENMGKVADFGGIAAIDGLRPLIKPE